MPELKDYVCEASGYKLDDLYGMPYEKAVLGSCIPDGELDEIMGLGGSKGILLTGPLGSGKETLSVGLAGSLLSCGYTYIRMPGSHLVRDPQLCGQIEEFVRSMAQNAEGAGVCLYLDDVTPLSDQPEVCEYLVNVLGSLLTETKHLAIVATATAKEDAPAALLKLLTECKVLPPTVTERRMLLERAFEQRIFLEKGCSVHTLAEMTEGFTYGQMEDAITHSLMLLKDKALNWYGKKRETLLQAWKNGQVLLKEEMFQSVVERLKQNVEIPPVLLSAGPTVQGQTENTTSEQKKAADEPLKELDFDDILKMNVYKA